MTTIPQDIMDAAAGINVNYTIPDPAEVRMAIAEAILAERERHSMTSVKYTERECFGILNPYGDVWTNDNVDSENAAFNHLHAFWKSFPGADVSGYRVVRVKARVSFVGEIGKDAPPEVPFPRP